MSSSLQAVRQRIADAAARSGRRESDVRLVVVTKYASTGDGFVESLLDAGCRDFGEARPQSLVEKAQKFITENIRWHFIGPLQRNKIRRLLPICPMIHSIDSIRLLEAVDRIAEEENLPVPPLLLEVNVSSEETKHGFQPDELSAVLDIATKMPRLTIGGLMGMSGLRSDESQKRREFQTLSQLAAKHGIRELSMGMSDDFEIAIEEGATIVRIGSLLYPC
ncbi:MAG: YggS family pyridoxal phosphate-dependent enzyme [Planctomycetaceae bacterium]|nr:YggS family pyridoxal phosphate-dependent enzyme [Planctomycetaceae bacterium]